MPSKKHLFYLVSGLFLAGALSVFATSIGTNVSVSGTLSVTGNSTLAGTVALSGTTGTSTIASGQGFTIGSSQFVVQQTSGNVGIGTTSPLHRLEIHSSVGWNQLSMYEHSQNANSVGAYLGVRDNISNVWSAWEVNRDPSTGVSDDPNRSASNIVLNAANASSYIKFSTNNINNADGIERMRIDGSGNVGIGTTSPGAIFSLAGIGSGTSNLLFSGVNTIYASSSTSTVPNNVVNAFSFATSTLVTPVLSVDTTSGGRIGIGTTTPAKTLSASGDEFLSSSATTTLFINSTDSTKGGCIELTSRNGAKFRAYATTTGPLILESGTCQ